jgi:hypothetical protein
MKRHGLTKTLIVLGGLVLAAVVGVSVTRPALVSNDKHVVIDPKSKQRVLVNELVIFSEGKDVASIVAEYNGVVTVVVRDTDTYQARFPVKSLNQLDVIADKLRKRGLKVQYAIVRKPPGPNEPQ